MKQQIDNDSGYMRLTCEADAKKTVPDTHTAGQKIDKLA